MPSLGGATEWLNSEPLGPVELRGRIVVLNFWTLTCINWLRTEPWVRTWSRVYRDDGLVVIGVQPLSSRSSTRSTSCGRRRARSGRHDRTAPARAVRRQRRV